MSINHEKLAEGIYVKKQTKSERIEPKKIGEFVSVNMPRISGMNTSMELVFTESHFYERNSKIVVNIRRI